MNKHARVYLRAKTEWLRSNPMQALHAMLDEVVCAIEATPEAKELHAFPCDIRVKIKTYSDPEGADGHAGDFEYEWEPRKPEDLRKLDMQVDVYFAKIRGWRHLK